MRVGSFVCICLLLLATTLAAECAEPTPQRKSFLRALLKSGIATDAVFTLMAIPTAEHYAVILSGVSPTRTVIALLYQQTDGMVQYLDRLVLHSHRLAKKSLTLRIHVPENGIAPVCLAEYWYCEARIRDERIVCEDL